MLHKIKIPSEASKHEYFWYLTCGWDWLYIEGQVKDENPVRYSAIKKIDKAKPLSFVELTGAEFKEVASWVDDAVDIKRDHIVEGPYVEKTDWTKAKQAALVRYYQKYFK